MSRNTSDCKSVAEVEGERDYEVVDLRRAINIVAFLLMSVGMMYDWQLVLHLFGNTF